MAVKKKIPEGYTYGDLFDTAEALDTGKTDSVMAGTISMAKGSEESVSDLYAKSSGELGSILGQADAIAANKKRRKEQFATRQAGFGTQQSILGGGAF